MAKRGRKDDRSLNPFLGWILLVAIVIGLIVFLVGNDLNGDGPGPGAGPGGPVIFKPPPQPQQFFFFVITESSPGPCIDSLSVVDLKADGISESDTWGNLTGTGLTRTWPHPNFHIEANTTLVGNINVGPLAEGVNELVQWDPNPVPLFIDVGSCP